MITGMREVIASALETAGINKVYTYNPARPIPTCAIVEPDGPFITVHDDEYEPNYTSNWNVLLMVAYGANDKETANLDETLDAVIPVLWSETPVTQMNVDKPFIMEVNGASFLSTNIKLSIEMQGGN